MTVNELIEQLKSYPGDMTVLTLGYEGGYDDIGLKTKDIVFNVYPKDTWYMGTHEETDVGLKDGETGEKCVVVVRI